MPENSSDTGDSSGPELYPNLGRLYDLVSGDEDARVCKDISEDACRHLPRNFFAYLCANFLTKIADELSSARLVLPWLLGALGAPAAFAGFLVPIRESGVLLPQLVVAAYIRRLEKRKVVWLVGGVFSCITLLLMAGAAYLFSGKAAGWLILLLVTVFSLARGLCSVSAKDVLGKTVSKTRRGALMGYSASLSGIAILLLGLYTSVYLGSMKASNLFLLFLSASALLWMLAIAAFWSIKEEAGATEGGDNAIRVALQSVALIRSDPAFRDFVIARTLLLSVALAPPFYVLFAQQYSQADSGLGLLIIASGLAGSLSAPFWGRMSDTSSRGVMVRAAGAAGALGILAWLTDVIGFSIVHSVWFHVALFFLIAMFHGGVRLGRKVYLLDMADNTNRSQYVAVSNTVIGVAMLFCGALGIIADVLETSSVLGLLGLASGLASMYISRIRDVSG